MKKIIKMTLYSALLLAVGYFSEDYTSDVITMRSAQQGNCYLDEELYVGFIVMGKGDGFINGVQLVGPFKRAAKLSPKRLGMMTRVDCSTGEPLGI